MNRFAHLAVSAVTALGIAAAPMPAAADSNDVAKALAGIVALGLVAKAIDDRNDRKDAEKKSRLEDERSRWGVIGSDERRLDRNTGRFIEGDLQRYDSWRRAEPQRGFQKNAPLPESCLYVVDRERGRDRLVYGQRCLNRSYKWANRLPSACRQLVRSRNDVIPVYSAHCLEQDGWRVTRR